MIGKGSVPRGQEALEPPYSTCDDRDQAGLHIRPPAKVAIAICGHWTAHNVDFIVEAVQYPIPHALNLLTEQIQARPRQAGRQSYFGLHLYNNVATFGLNLAQIGMARTRPSVRRFLAE